MANTVPLKLLLAAAEYITSGFNTNFAVAEAVDELVCRRELS
jgi:hypothetical protein